MSDTIANELWGSRSIKWVAVDSVGYAGGIIILWDERKVQVTNSWGGRFSLLTTVKNEKGHQSLLSAMYGPVLVFQEGRVLGWIECSEG